MNNKLTRP